jgi:hypothetical protein
MKMKEKGALLFDGKSLNESLALFMQVFYNWNDLLTTGAIGSLLEWSIATLYTDITNTTSTGDTEYFRSALRPIIRRAHLSFRKAYANMKEIQKNKVQIQNHAMNATNYLTSTSSRQEEITGNLLMETLLPLIELAERSKEMSNEVAQSYQMVIESITEIIRECNARLKEKFVEVRPLNKTVIAAKQSREDEIVWHQEKNWLLDKMWRNFENKQPNIYMETWLDNRCFNTNNISRQNPTKSIKRQRKNLSEDELRSEFFFRAGNWRYLFQEIAYNEDDCLEGNHLPLFDLLSTGHQLTKKCQTNGDDEVEELMKKLNQTLGILNQSDCDLIKKVATTFKELATKIKPPSTTNLKHPKTEQLNCPGSKEMDDLASLIAHRHIKLIQKNNQENNLLFKDLNHNPNMSTIMHQHQRDRKLELVKIASSILELNEQTTKIWWQRTEPFLKKIFEVMEKANAFNEGTTFNEILMESLHQFTQHKKSWDKLTNFISKLAYESKITVMGSFSLMEITRINGNSHRNTETSLNHTDMKHAIIRDLLNRIEKVKQGSLSIENIASKFVSVTERYITDMLSVEDRNNSVKTESVFSISAISQQKLAIRKCYLRQSSRNRTLSICRNPEKGLKAFGIILIMKEDDESLIKRQLLQTRKDILKEYQWIMADCQSPVA